MTAHGKSATRPSSVTTGPIPGSRKIYLPVGDRSDLTVPFREVVLDPTSGEVPFRLYDTSGPYSDPAAAIDLATGLAPLLSRRPLHPKNFPRRLPPHPPRPAGQQARVGEGPPRRIETRRPRENEVPPETPSIQPQEDPPHEVSPPLISATVL